MKNRSVFCNKYRSKPSISPDATIESIVDNFSTALEEFDKALKESDKLPSVALARECDTARDTAWSGLNAYCKAMATYHPSGRPHESGTRHVDNPPFGMREQLPLGRR